MELLATRNRKQLWFHELLEPYSLNKPFPDLPYVCILFANETDITDRDKFALCNQIYRTDCRYAVCAGVQCEAWHDEIDNAFISSDSEFSPPDELFIMTSWHTEESIADVIFFGLNCTNFDTFKFVRYLVLSVGHRVGLREEILEAVKVEWDASRIMLDD